MEGSRSYAQKNYIPHYTKPKPDVVKLPDEKFEVLNYAAEGVLTKLYTMKKLIPFTSEVKPSDSIWKAGILPDAPKLCFHLVKKFPEHPRLISLEKVDRASFEVIRSQAEDIRARLEPLYMILVDAMLFSETATRVLFEFAGSVSLFEPQKAPAMFISAMELFCNFVRVHLMLERTCCKLIIQIFALAHDFVSGGCDPELFLKLVGFVECYDPAVKGLRNRFKPFSRFIGRVTRTIGYVTLMPNDIQAFRSSAFLSPFSANQTKVNDEWKVEQLKELLNLEKYQAWLVFGSLACPDEFSEDDPALTFLLGIIQNTYVFPLFREEVIYIHDLLQSRVPPESQKLTKIDFMKRTTSARDLDPATRGLMDRLEETRTLAIDSMAEVHRRRRVMIKQELQRLETWLTDEPKCIGPNLFTVLSAMSFGRSELIWYLSHANRPITRDAEPVILIPLESNDPTIGFILNGLYHLQMLLKLFTPEVWSYVKQTLGEKLKWMRVGVKGLIEESADRKPHFEAVLAPLLATLQEMDDNLRIYDLSRDNELSIGEGFRTHWLHVQSICSTVGSKLSLTDFDQPRKLNRSRGSLLETGNLIYDLSRVVDDLDGILREYSSLKALCFFRTHLVSIFRQTMFGPKAEPQNCPAWMAVAWSFPDNEHHSYPSEVSALRTAATDFADSLLEALMGGLDFYLAALDSEKGISGLDSKLDAKHAAMLMNYVAGSKGQSPDSKAQLHIFLPGFESDPRKRGPGNELDVTLQRFVALVSSLNEMVAIEVEGCVFVPGEYVRERLTQTFRRRLRSVVEGSKRDLKIRPAAFHSNLLRLCTAFHVLEQHSHTDASRSLREVLVSETFTEKLRDLHQLDVQTSNESPVVGSVTESLLNDVALDKRHEGVLFSPLTESFVGSAEGKAEQVVLNAKDVRCFADTFGAYGVDNICAEVREILRCLLSKFERILRSNTAVLVDLSQCLHVRDRRMFAIDNIQDLELAMAICIQIGHCLNVQKLVSTSAARAMKEHVPLIFSTLRSMAKHVPTGAPEVEQVAQIRRLAARFGAGEQSPEVMSLLMELGGVGDRLWSLLPYFLGAMMSSDVWKGSGFNSSLGVLNNNSHCFARCVDALIEGCESSASERKALKSELIAQQKQARATNTEGDGYDEDVIESVEEIELAIRKMFATFLEAASIVTLANQTRMSRGAFFSQVIFLDMLCESSRFLSRNVLETHLPFSLTQSAYEAYFQDGNSSGHAPLGLDPKLQFQNTARQVQGYVGSSSISRQSRMNSNSSSKYTSGEEGSGSGSGRMGSPVWNSLSSASFRVSKASREKSWGPTSSFAERSGEDVSGDSKKEGGAIGWFARSISITMGRKERSKAPSEDISSKKQAAGSRAVSFYGSSEDLNSMAGETRSDPSGARRNHPHVSSSVDGRSVAEDGESEVSSMQRNLKMLTIPRKRAVEEESGGEDLVTVRRAAELSKVANPFGRANA